MENHLRDSAKKELYILIAKFLENGPCKNTLKCLKEELTEHRIIPSVSDWEGETHQQEFDTWINKFQHVKPNFLLDYCVRLGPLVDEQFKPSAPGVRTLLGSGNQSLLRTNKDGTRKCWRHCDYTTRYHQTVPLRPKTCNLPSTVHLLSGRELSGPLRKDLIFNNNFFKNCQLLKKTLGHLSAVYCVLFDKTGKYIITGADDYLVKLWSVMDGRLIWTFRGCSSEITDIAVNVRNTLIAAGSLDKTVRVWTLQAGYPVATLSSNSGTITGVYFCPLNLDDTYYLVSTASDGTVSFWSYTEDPDNTYTFKPQPVVYHEKIRPGQAQITCGSFSAGGMFFAVGSADHHVRIYCMDGEIPLRVMEEERHTERVDNIQWANRSLRLVTGSKDGTAIIWHYQAQRWHTIILNMNTSLSGDKANEAGKVKVTMVCWTADDLLIVTAVSDFSLKVWDSATGNLRHTLSRHTDVAFVLENHPIQPQVMLSSGHDGMALLWDVMTGQELAVYENRLEGGGFSPVYDAKWSPDGTIAAATDSEGHLLIFGTCAPSLNIYKIPQELFFHTDYRPLEWQADGSVFDSQTQLPPHLMPPPFLVDIDGNPYPPHVQRMVPGRKFCTSEQLVPNVVVSDIGQREVVEAVPERLPRHSEEGSPARPRGRRSGSVEGVRQSVGDWQDSDAFLWTRPSFIPPLLPAHRARIEHSVKELSGVELREFRRESTKPPEEVQVPISHSERPHKGKKKRMHSYRTRATYDHREETPSAGSSAASGETSDSTAQTADLSGGSSSSDSESTVYSDWVADHGVRLEPPKRSRRRRQPPATAPVPAPAEPVASTSRRKAPPGPRAPPPSPPPVATPSTSHEMVSSNAGLSTEIPEAYRLSEWLSEVVPKKFPYYPQMGDEVVFFKRGYLLYLNAVRDKKVYQLAKSQLLPWGKLNIKEPELVKVIGIKYELRPPRLCCLRLAVVDSNRTLTGDRFTIKYHDVPDVIDFLVLKHTYDTAIQRNWKTGDRFRSMIDDSWWWGLIEGRGAHADSHFLCHRIKWDNGEQEDMSPWDMEPVDPDREPVEGGSVPVLAEEIAATLYQPREEEWPGADRDTACTTILSRLTHIMSLSIAESFNAPVDINLYPSYAYCVEYPIDLSLIKARFENRFYRRLTAAQFDARYLATNAEKFNEPHSAIVKHARIITDLCLEIMKEDCQSEVKVMYRQLVDGYRSSDTSAAEEPTTEEPVRRQQRAAASRFLRAMRRANRDQDQDWRADCSDLLDLLWNCSDSQPFREPVDTLKYPDYERVVETPLDLSTIREELRGDNYSSPQDFCKDIRTMVRNSKIYNTNKRSQIYMMTMRLSAIAEEHLKRILTRWKSSGHKGRRKLTATSRQANQRKRKSFYQASDLDDSDADYVVSSTKPLMRNKGASKRNPRHRHTGRRNMVVVANGTDDSGSSKAANNYDSALSEDERMSAPINGWDMPSTSKQAYHPRRAVPTRNQSSSDSSGSNSRPGAVLNGVENNSSLSPSDEKSESENGGSASEKSIPKTWSLNETGTVRILRPVRRSKTPEMLELEVGNEVELGGESGEENESSSSKALSRAEESDSSEEDDDDLVEVGEEPSTHKEQPPLRLVLRTKRARSSSGSERPSRPRRQVRNKSYCNESDSGSQRRPRRQPRRHYHESSDSEHQPPEQLSISSHGRVRKIRPQVRAFLKDS